LPELRLISPPDRPALLAQLRARLGHAVPGAQLIAEGIRGADSTIDFVALEPGGAVVLVLVGAHDEDLELIGRALAQRAWVAPRLRDWAQLAPSLGLRADAPVRALLLCPAYRPESRMAIDALGRSVLAAGLYRCIHNGSGTEVVIEHVGFAEADEAPATPARTPEPAAAEPPAAPFRTGLTDADLGLTPEEKREFE
jgi:hypothetical protein